MMKFLIVLVVLGVAFISGEPVRPLGDRIPVSKCVDLKVKDAVHGEFQKLHDVVTKGQEANKEQYEKAQRANEEAHEAIAMIKDFWYGAMGATVVFLVGLLGYILRPHLDKFFGLDKS